MARVMTTVHAEWHGVRLMNCYLPPSHLERDLDRTGLITMSAQELQLHTGIAAGPVRISIQSLDSAPTTTEVGWDDIAEVSLAVGAGPLVLVGAMETPKLHAPRLDEFGSGTYRLRVHGRNRDDDYDMAVSETAEEYLILSWIAPAAPPATLALSSRASSSWIASIKSTPEKPRPDYAAAVSAGSATPSDDLRQKLKRHSLTAEDGIPQTGE